MTKLCLVLLIVASATTAQNLRHSAVRRLGKNHLPENQEQVEAAIAKDVKKLEGLGLSEAKAEKKARKHELKRAKMEEKKLKQQIKDGTGSKTTAVEEKSMEAVRAHASILSRFKVTRLL